MSLLHKTCLALAILACIPISGCGDGSPPTSEPLSSVETPPPAPESTKPPPPPPPPPSSLDFSEAEPAEESEADDAEPEPDPEPEPATPGSAYARASKPDDPPTPEEAKAALEKLGGRVAADESGRFVKVFLNRTGINDQQIAVIKYLPDVQVVNLTGTPITDAGVEHLRALPNLQRVYAAHTKITVEGEDGLEETLTGCELYR